MPRTLPLDPYLGLATRSEGQSLLGDLVRSGRRAVARDGEVARCRESHEVSPRAAGIIKSTQIEILDCGIGVVDLIRVSVLGVHRTVRGMTHGHLRLSFGYCFNVASAESDIVGG